MGLLVVRVAQRQGPLGDLGERLEGEVPIRDVSDDNLAGVDLVDEELLHLAVSLVLLEVAVDDKHVLVHVSGRLLDLLEEDNHVRGCLDLYASPI